MRSPDPFNMRPVWDSLLDIYKEFAKICDQHGLRYYFMEGNAIGALRHKGFVPWDDDIDVAMPRPDYEKFVAIAKQELPSYLRFWDWHDVKDSDAWQYTFGKIQDTREEKVFEVEKGVGHLLSNGLYIDILVIDGFPTGKLAQLTYKTKMFLFGSMVRRLVTQFKGQTLGGKFSWLCGAVGSFVLNVHCSKSVLARIEKLMLSVPFENAKLTWRAGAALRVTMTFPREIWNGAVHKEFDEITVPLPSGYDIYLRTQYGDYMQLPPESSQHPSHEYKYRCAWWLGPTAE